MATDYGYSFIRVPGTPAPLVIPPGEPIPVDTEEPTRLAEVVELYEDDPDTAIIFPKLDWKRIVEPDTFLDKWMTATVIDDVPEEYHFWHGMIALSMAVGRNVQLSDSHPILANLFVCILGHSGSGKSKSRAYLDKLLAAALPHDGSALSTGTFLIGSPASAEALVGSFSRPIYDDPSDPKHLTGYGSVRGLVDFNELSALMGRTQRQGNVLKPTLMEFYDGRPKVSTVSVTHGVKEAHEPFCSVLTTTQPKVIKRLVTQEDADSGFLNRWIFAAGPGKPRYAIGSANVDVTDAAISLSKVYSWAGFPKRAEWEPNAVARVQEFFVEKLWKARDNDETGMLIRLDLLFKKLCLLFSCNEQSLLVSEQTVERVIEMYDYILDCYAIPAAQIGTTLQSEVREAIQYQTHRFTKQNGIGASASDLARALKRKNYPMDLLLKVMDYMVQLGELQMITHKAPGPGRPTVRYKSVG